MKHRARPTVILVYGESPNDTQSIAELIQALAPGTIGRVQVRKQPLVLMKNAPPEKLPGYAEKIAAAVRAEKVRQNVGSVFLHEDCDAVEPGHEAVCRKIEEAMRRSGCPAHAVVPAWEIESWWFLFPGAVRAAKPAWREPNDHIGKRVGLIPNAKEAFERCVRPKGRTGKRVPTYRESDSPAIAKKIRELKCAASPQAKSESYDRFCKAVAAAVSAPAR